MTTKYLSSKITISPSYYTRVHVKTILVDGKVSLVVQRFSGPPHIQLCKELLALKGKVYLTRREITATVRDLLRSQYEKQVLHKFTPLPR